MNNNNKMKSYWKKYLFTILNDVTALKLLFTSLSVLLPQHKVHMCVFVWILKEFSLSLSESWSRGKRQWWIINIIKKESVKFFFFSSKKKCKHCLEKYSRVWSIASTIISKIHNKQQEVRTCEVSGHKFPKGNRW